jgi:hypothetical protein
MPYTGVHYAYGPADIEEGIPASAFSRGDLLVFDSNSSLSGAPLSNLSAIDLAGIAQADSDASFRNRVPYIKARNDTVVWSELTGGLTSAITAGRELSFEADEDGRPVATSNDNDPAAVVERPFDEIENLNSGVSRIMLRLLSTPSGGGGLEHDA